MFKNFKEFLNGNVINETIRGLDSFLYKKDTEKNFSRDTGKYVHLSSLLNMTCPRYYNLLFKNPKYHTVGADRSAQRHVWEIGRALEAHLRTNLVEYFKPENCLGEWSCKCGKTTHRGFLDNITICRFCDTSNNRYGEYVLTHSEYGLIASPDFICKINGKLLVFEIKSSKKETYEELQATPEEELTTTTKNILLKHKMQAISYVELLRGLGNTVHDNYLLAYIAKDFTFKTAPYFFKEVIPTEQDIKNTKTIFSRAKEIYNLKLENKLPDRICETLAYAKKYKCDIASLCFKED